VIQVDASEIRALFNSSRDGTASDAVVRQLCQVALGECCVFDDGIPGHRRYGTSDEIADAHRRIVDILERRGRARMRA